MSNYIGVKSPVEPLRDSADYSAFQSLTQYLWDSSVVEGTSMRPIGWHEGDTVPKWRYRFPLLYSLNSTRYELATSPLVLTETVVGQTKYVQDNLLHCWGSGKTLEKAKDDLRRNLIEEYEDLLDAGPASLSKLARRRLQLLKRHVERK